MHCGHGGIAHAAALVARTFDRTLVFDFVGLAQASIGIPSVASMREAQAIDGFRRPASQRLTIEGDVPSTSLSFDADQSCSSNRSRSCSRASRDFAMPQALLNSKHLSSSNATAKVLSRGAPWQPQRVEKPPFRENLSAALKMASIGQSDLARRVGVDPSQVTRWLSGEREPSGPILLAMSRLFGIDPWVLLGADAVEPRIAEAAPARGRPRKQDLARALGEDPLVPPVRPKKKST